MRILFLLLLMHAKIWAQEANTKLDNWLQDNLKDLGGRAVLMVYKDGKIIYENSVNEISKKQKRRAKIVEKIKKTEIDLNDFTPDVQQPVASCSKWFTAALAMTYIEEGKLNINDTIGKYLPIMTSNEKGAITIWQCLSHLTGIQSPGIKEDLKVFKTFANMNDAIGYIAKQPMEGTPGKTFHYSNMGLQIVAAIIEKISTKTFQDVFNERIAKPLEMQNTDWGKGNVPLAAGGAHSTANDYLKFLTMILNNGIYQSKQILSPKSIEAMQINRVEKDVVIKSSPAEAGNWGYGFGEWVMETSTEGNLTTAVTSPGLFGTFPWVDNKHQYCAILFTVNINNKGRHTRYKELKQLVDEFVQ